MRARTRSERTRAWSRRREARHDSCPACGVRIAVSAVQCHFSCFVHGASQIPYAPAAHWDHVFRTLRQASTDLDWGEQWVGAFAPILHTRHVQRLLDLGCGTGNDVQRLAQRRDTVVGLDYSREAITQAARKAGSRTAFLVADMATPLPFMTGSFEAVMSNVALHMFDDARTWRLLTEVRRIVQPQGLLLFHVNALEDCPLRAKRKPPVRERAPNDFLEADGQTMHFFSAAYRRELLTGWGEGHLELIESAAHTTGEPFKCVWRGVAHACPWRYVVLVRLTATHSSPIRAGVNALCGSCPVAGGSPSISTSIRAEKGCAADALQPALRSGFPSCQH